MPYEWNSTWSETPGFGASFKQSLRQPGQWILLLEGFGEVLPYKDNRVILDRKTDRFGIPQLRFEVSYRANEQRMGVDIVRQATAMLKAAGATDIKPSTTPFTPGTSIHEFGGARMGHDSRDSVLNKHNQAHDVPNLFVTDGSCMTSTSCVNPSLTFMALTARAAHYAVERLQVDGTLRRRSPV